MDVAAPPPSRSTRQSVTSISTARNPSRGVRATVACTAALVDVVDAVSRHEARGRHDASSRIGLSAYATQPNAGGFFLRVTKKKCREQYEVYIMRWWCSTTLQRANETAFEVRK